EDDGWSAADGTSLRLLADTSDGRRVEVAGLAGGTPEFLLQSLVATFVVPDDEPLPGAGLLAAVAEAWDPDYGDVGDRAVTAALKKEAGFRTGTPSVGPVAYLSPGRAALVPEEWAARGRRLPGGGLLLELADPGDTAEVVRAHRALKDAGALEPLPRPMDRPALCRRAGAGPSPPTGPGPSWRPGCPDRSPRPARRSRRASRSRGSGRRPAATASSSSRSGRATPSRACTGRSGTPRRRRPRRACGPWWRAWTPAGERTGEGACASGC